MTQLKNRDFYIPTEEEFISLGFVKQEREGTLYRWDYGEITRFSYHTGCWSGEYTEEDKGWKIGIERIYPNSLDDLKTLISMLEIYELSPDINR